MTKYFCVTNCFVHKHSPVISSFQKQQTIFNLLMPENARLNPAKLGKMFQLEIKIELKYSEISNKIRETSIDTISYSKGLLKRLIMNIPCKACF